MRNRGLLITTVCLGIGALAVLMFDRSKTKDKDARLGQPLLSPTVVAEADTIEISKGETTLKLVRDASQVWHLTDTNGFVADAQKILRLIDDLGRSRYSVVVASKAEKFSDFGLSAPIKLSLSGNNAKLIELGLGDNRTAGGIYVNPIGESTVYVVDPALSIAVDADQWELKSLLDIKKEQIKSLVFYADASAPPLTVERPKADEPLKLIGIKEPQKEKPTVAQLDTLLQGINFTKRVDPSNEEAKAAFAKPQKTIVTLFDQRTYELEIGSVGSKWFLKVIGAGNGAESDAAIAAELKRLQDLMLAHAFEIPAYIAQRLTKKPEDLIETPTVSPDGKG